MEKGLEFDPGFGPHILAFQGSVEYIYMDINRFKNLSQRKMRFRQFYKKILETFYNNIGFYIGCLMWAAYIKTQPEQPILNNHCLGGEYNTENETEVDFIIKFSELFPKDMKYFLGETFVFDDYVSNILKLYKEFIDINKGFVETKTNTDIKLPENLKIDKASEFKEIIDKIIKQGNLAKFIEYTELI